MAYFVGGQWSQFTRPLLTVSNFHLIQNGRGSDLHSYSERSEKTPKKEEEENLPPLDFELWGGPGVHSLLLLCHSPPWPIFTVLSLQGKVVPLPLIFLFGQVVLTPKYRHRRRPESIQLPFFISLSLSLSPRDTCTCFLFYLSKDTVVQRKRRPSPRDHWLRKQRNDENTSTESLTVCKLQSLEEKTGTETKKINDKQQEEEDEDATAAEINK